MNDKGKQRLANGIRDRAYKADPIRHSPPYPISPGLALLTLAALLCLAYLIKLI